MENKELDDAIDWLRRTVALEERFLTQHMDEEQKNELLTSLERKRKLLAKLESLNSDLNLSSKSTA